MISPEKWLALEKRMKTLQLEERDLTEKFIRGSGSGGQKINKTNSCVFLRHEATGLEVKCQRTRSQKDNRYFARRLLCEKLEAQISQERSEKEKAIAKLKRQKRKRSKRAKEKVLENKKQRSETKSLRRKPSSYD